MTIETPFSAVLTSWTPPVQTETSLAVYLKSRKLQIMGNQNGQIDWDNYSLSLDRHLKRLNDFLSEERADFQNLVFGRIQSGKTAHLLANICWAKDNGIDVVVLFSGVTIDLNQQTTERLISDLPPGAALVETVPTERSEESVRQIVNRVHEVIQKRFSDNQFSVPLLVMLKNPNRLTAAQDILSKIQSRAGSGLSVLVIDDEADQASPDARVAARQRGRRFNQSSRTTHGSILGIQQTVKGKLIYLSYTATPQALIHGELENELHPRFCSVIPAGSDYVGINDVATYPGALISISDMAVYDPTDQDFNEDASALENALAEFLVSSWLHRNHLDIFHKETPVDFECSWNSVQMLIHPSSGQVDHRDYEVQVSELLKYWQDDLDNPRTSLSFINDIIEPAYSRVIARCGDEAFTKLNNESEIKSCIDHLYMTLRNPSALQIRLINSDRRAELKRLGRESDFLPSKPNEWRGKDWILIGGDILGRGLTIPHLVSTFFLRNPQNPNFDVSMQQMRFCGYRRDYLHILRVVAPDQVIDDYKDASIIESRLRRRAAIWDKNNRDLQLDPPIIRFEAPENARYSPTRNAVMSVDITRKDIGNSGFFGLQKVVDPKLFDKNISFLTNFFATNSFSQIVETFNILELDPDALIEFMSQFVVDPIDQPDFESFKELLAYNDSEGGLRDSKIRLVVDAELEQIANVSFRKNSNVSSLINWRFNRSVSGLALQRGLDWFNPKTEDDFSKLKIQTLVGAPERKIPDIYPDDVSVHVRLYALYQNAQDKTGPFGWGLSIIGWTPTQKTQLWIHEGAI